MPEESEVAGCDEPGGQHKPWKPVQSIGQKLRTFIVNEAHDRPASISLVRCALKWSDLTSWHENAKPLDFPLQLYARMFEHALAHKFA